MSRPHDRSTAMHRAVQAMEDDVSDAAGFAQLVCALGASNTDVAPTGLYTLGVAMEAWAARLNERWQAAFALIGPQD